MDRKYSSSSQFDPRRYEGYLSLFGRKVLDSMLKKWNADRIRNQNHSSSYQFRIPPPDPPGSNWPRTKKVLTFLSEQPRSPLLLQPPQGTCIDIPNANNDIEQPFDFNVNEKHKLPTVHCVHTTNELLKTFEQTSNSRTDEVYISTRNRRIEEVNSSTNNIRKDEVSVSTYDMINPGFYENKARNIMHDFYNRLDDDGVVSNNLTKTARNDDELAKTTGVKWDNMFDTELLPVATNIEDMIQENTTSTPENNFGIVYIEGTSDTVCKTGEMKLTKIKETNRNDVKYKRKAQPKVTDIIPKKVKKVSETEKPKNSFRKQTYTKTVKNWLDGVNSNNPVEEEVIGKKIINEEAANNTETVVLDEKKGKPNKKIVQAQLANKDGIMKFGKPKDKVETEKVVVKSNDKSDATKDKKTKPKFVAPIKSQVPVKEVDYEVITVDSTNIRELKDMESLRFVVDKDLVVVLVYNNGFCQLNKHHTEEICDPEGFIISTNEKFYFFKDHHQRFKEVICLLLENNRVICYEGKSLLIYFKSKFDLEFKNLTIIDTKIGGSLLDPDNPPESFSDLQKLLSYTPEYTIATECVQQKTAWYATLLDECGLKLTTALKENGVWSIFVEIEMKLMPIIAEMERRGVTVDLQKLKLMEDILLSKMKEIEQECYKAAGRTFQLNSAVQVRAIIYDELQLDTKCNVKIKETICKGAKSTSEIMLRSLVAIHPLPKLILEYRHLHKAHATFLTGIAQQVRDGVVRPTWVQTAAVTGRIASNNPNLQAIPKAPFSLILFPDENNSGNQTLSIRSVYKSREGYTLVAADFQHVECRVFAHCAGDTSLTQVLQAGGDLFRALAAKWLSKPECDVSSEDRERTKRIVYASLYGAGCRKLMDILGVNYEQALTIIASFNRTFPSLKSFGRSVVARCEQTGGRLSTLCGRARQFKHIASRDFQLKAQAERQAVNFVVQGSAADLCKMAMVLTSQGLRAHRPPVDACLLLQIHDELVWEVRDEHVDTAAGIIREVMEGCGQHCGMPVALPVALSAGRTWGDMAHYEPNIQQ